MSLLATRLEQSFEASRTTYGSRGADRADEIGVLGNAARRGRIAAEASDDDDARSLAKNFENNENKKKCNRRPWARTVATKDTRPNHQDKKKLWEAWDGDGGLGETRPHVEQS